ncbi:AbrB/MazE/SpoVT family DNA-binding domain-containing protein [Mesorhizobium amorphae]|uniref:Transcriptional regulator/antitoxin, MazE n=1 Tax=Mesorhizobium amorphae CCNWGS0123 TaxID=1082933 RepID=G6Y885_9HYPH|nr:AbrB/MazE/SpoVT family DNA-binding domain-containing protein [Mesorhizobium amorphae]EHH12052.1 transcriptional regulator/antitoxin, MazE [Mesorhizobium amorphae CCNWGS0123]
MQTTISRWGNSLALRLPKHVTEEVRLVEGVCVNVEIEDGSIRVTPTRKRFQLSELLKGETRQETGNREVDWGQPKGDEVW